MGVKIKFLKESSGIIYEIVAPLGNNSPVTGVIVRGHGFLNHIAYTTERFDEEINRLRSEGMVPLGPRKKAKAFLGAKVCFFLTRLGYIIELIDGKISVDLFLKNKLP
ncbi:VOC family protein [Alphaproteobacteria bacterium]|nr:VOC family protein [Alphaproteobacteria bacterium]